MATSNVTIIGMGAAAWTPAAADAVPVEKADASDDGYATPVQLVTAGNTELRPAAFVSSAYTNATATMSNVTGLSLTLATGSFAGTLRLRCSNTTAADGLKLDFDAGTATVTAFAAGVISNEQGATPGVTRSTAKATDLTFTALADTSDHWIEVAVILTCSVAGTLIPRAALNAATTGTVTLDVGSTFAIQKA